MINGEMEKPFIRKFMEKYNKEFEFIYIKAPYFTDKLEFRKNLE